MSNDDAMIILMISGLVWFAFGWIGDSIRKNYFHEQTIEPCNFFLGPICIIMSGIEALIIKCQEHKLHKTRKEAQKPVDKYEKRAIERIDMLLEINN